MILDASLPAAAGIGATSFGMKCEVPSIRTYFYVGGKYVTDGETTLRRDHMYVERLLPVQGVTQTTPVILVPGNGQTGTNFLNKPDGGRGWASNFIAHGYEVYIVDQALRGRSPRDPKLPGSSLSAFSAEVIEQRFTSIAKHKLWPQASRHTQWPDSGEMGGPVFDAFYSTCVEYVNDKTYVQTAVRDAGAALLDKIGKPVHLLGHSQAGALVAVIADARPGLTKSLIMLEPLGPPFREVIFSSVPARAWGLADIPLCYDPPVTDPRTELVLQTRPAASSDTVDCILQAESPAPRKLVNLSQFPILVVTSEAGYHAVYDAGTVQYLQQAGCNVSHLELGKVGIHGNSHMFFIEKNSDEIYTLLEEWIAEA